MKKVACRVCGRPTTWHAEVWHYDDPDADDDTAEYVAICDDCIRGIIQSIMAHKTKSGFIHREICQNYAFDSQATKAFKLFCEWWSGGGPNVEKHGSLQKTLEEMLGVKLGVELYQED